MGFVAYVGRWVKPIKKAHQKGGPIVTVYREGLSRDAGPIAGGHVKQLTAALLPLVNVVNVGPMRHGRYSINKGGTGKGLGLLKPALTDG